METLNVRKMRVRKSGNRQRIYQAHGAALVRSRGGGRQKGDLLDNAIRQNVIDNVAKLKSATPILSAAVEQKKLRVVGGIYRLKDGEVDMMD
jgi:carbonic anhydrase